MINPRGLKRMVLSLALVFLLSACGMSTVRSIPTEAQGEIFVAPTLVLPTPTATVVKPTKDATAVSEEKSCQDVLSFVSDISIPDGTVVSPGGEIDKRWEVKNSGTCDWGKDYTIRLVSGDALGVAEEQSLIPAAAGKTATIQIVFTAPDKSGTYRSAWQAANPNGDLFGDEFYVEVKVQN